MYGCLAKCIYTSPRGFGGIGGKGREGGRKRARGIASTTGRT